MTKKSRPVKYTRALGQQICIRLVHGESLRRIAEDPAMPGLATIVTWLERHPSFRSAYERAREIEADVLADEVVDIADEDAGDGATAAKLRVDARKWLAAKLKPATYGTAKAPRHKEKARTVVYRVSTGIARAPDEAEEPGAEPSKEAQED